METNPQFTHSYLYDATEQIDAAMFSGDSFMDPKNRAGLRFYIQRWLRELKVWDEEHEAGSTESVRYNLLTPEQCAQQFEFLAQGNRSLDDRHSLRYCAQFLREFCIQPKP
jgi:hypothetical protein